MTAEDVVALQLAGYPQLTPSLGCCPIRSAARAILLQ